MGSKDLWQLCDRHGTVADVYIGQKLSKLGRRFAFVRFLRIKNSESLIEELNKLWFGNYHLSASKARFERKPSSLNKSILKSLNFPSRAQSNPTSHANHNRSYAATLNGTRNQSDDPKGTTILKSIVLDASDLIDTSAMKNVILVKVGDVNLILNIN
ncbi:RNA-directed DNA polymerase, eukaryota, partial [Tanacetum coccineum]